MAAALNGIGPKIASEIVEYRKMHGDFGSAFRRRRSAAPAARTPVRRMHRNEGPKTHPDVQGCVKRTPTSGVRLPACPTIAKTTVAGRER